MDLGAHKFIYVCSLFFFFLLVFFCSEFKFRSLEWEWVIGWFLMEKNLSQSGKYSTLSLWWAFLQSRISQLSCWPSEGERVKGTKQMSLKFEVKILTQNNKSYVKVFAAWTFVSDLFALKWWAFNPGKFYWSNSMVAFLSYMVKTESQSLMFTNSLKMDVIFLSLSLLHNQENCFNRFAF